MDWKLLLLVCFIGGVLAVKPVLRPAQPSVEKSQNESYVVFCTAGTEEVVWTGPKGKSLPKFTGRIHVEDKGPLGQALLFDRIEASDRGRYTCTSVTKDTVAFELSVVKTSQFVNTPTEHRVVEFQNTVIRCEVEGEPKPLITWQRNGKSLDANQKYVVGNKGLRINNATKSDAGVYTCRALQVARDDGFIETVDITLKVQHPPEWKDPQPGPTLVYGYVTGESNLTCEAIAQPEANYTWYRNTNKVKDMKLNTTEILEPERSVLQILIHNDSFFGDYKCQAKNSFGAINKTFELRKGEKPDPPTGFRVTEVTVHTASLKLASEAPDLVGYRVQFVISVPGQEITWDRPEYQDLPKSESGHYSIRDLLEDTPYTVRVATRNPAGLSDYTATPLTLRTLKIGEVPSSSVRIVGQLVSVLAALLAVSAVH